MFLVLSFLVGGKNAHLDTQFLSGPIPCYPWDTGALTGLGEFIQSAPLSTEDTLSQNCMFISFPTYAFAGHFGPASP